MKPYGNTRRDNLTCKYGCCHSFRVRGRDYSPKRSHRRPSKKRARRIGKDLARAESEAS